MTEAIQALLPIIGPGGIGVLAAVWVYLKINNQRKETKNIRDNDYALLEYRIGQLENNQSSLTDSISELQKSIISLQISVNELVCEIKHMKEGK